MTKAGKDMGASVRASLLRLARERGDDFQLLLTRYANERLLYRLAASRHSARFVLKGAALFTVWTGTLHRATRDLELLGFGDPSEDHVRSVFADVIALDVVQDGVVFVRRPSMWDPSGKIRRTAACASPLPAGLPVTLTPAFTDDPAKKTQWAAFVRKAGARDAGELQSTAFALTQFIAQPLIHAGSGSTWEATWPPGGA